MPAELGHWQPLVDALGWTLIDFCWQGLLLAAAYAAMRGALGPDRPAARVRAGYLTLLGLAAAPVLTLWQRWPGPAAAATGTPSVESWGIAVAATPATGWLDAAMPWLVAAWAIGVLLLAGRAAIQWWRLQAICRSALPLGPDWERRLAQLRRSFRVLQPVRLRESCRIATPLLLGVLRPVILLPAGLALRLPSAQVELLLAHELAHLRRWDHLANLLQVVVETILFYHPAVHWVSRRVREDREHCCDDLVAAAGSHPPVDYARALLAVAEERVHMPRMALAAGGGRLLHRVERIVGMQSAQPAAGRMLVLGAALGVLLLGHLWSRSEVTLAALELPLPVPAPQFERLPTPIAGLTIGDLLQRRWSPPPPTPLPPVALELPAPAPPAAAVTASAAETAVVADPVAQPTESAISRAARLGTAAALQAPPAPAAGPLAPPAVDEAGATAPTLRIVRAPAPHYPAVAAQHGIEGTVELSFVVSAAGRASDIRVEHEDRPGLFGSAAESAVRRWLFESGQDDGVRHRRVFDFRLDDSDDVADAMRVCMRNTGSRICRR
jgi:bla regulator protein blaR1